MQLKEGHGVVRKALLGEVGDAEIRLLHIFKTVVECGGFSAAELELDIGRSTVSRHIQALETRLGVTLCRRGRAGFALSAEGEHVYQGALKLLDAMDGFRAGVADLREDIAGKLAIGIFDKTASNPQAHIGRALRALRRSAPGVRVDITVGAIGAIEAGVIGGKLQVGIVPGHRRSEMLEYHELFGERMYLYCGRGHALFATRARALGLAQIQEHDYAGLAFHSPNMEATHRFGLRRRATANDQEAIATLILSGDYVGFLPDHYAETFERAGTMRRVPCEECTYQVRFVAVLRKGAQQARVARAFLAQLLLVHVSG
jgi:LysR family transcriptional regulator, transcriptional activator for bauABCD operon